MTPRRRRGLALLAAATLLFEPGCSLVTNIVASEKRDVYHFDHEFGAGDPQFRRSMDTFGTAMVGGNSARLLKNGDEIFPAMVGAIRAAKLSVNLETYIYADDRAGRLFTDALIDAARRGVEVRVLVDATGGKAGSHFAEMEKAGVKIKVYRPIRLWTIHKVGRRTHRKILVVDGNVSFTGGLGIDERWLGDARNPKEWRDTQVMVTGPVSTQMQSIFAEGWTYTTGEILAGEKFYPRASEPGVASGETGDVHAQAIKVSRGDSSSLSKMLYYVAIQSARKSILIQNAYFLPDAQVREGLVRAVSRGAVVEVMVPGPHIDLPPIRSASRKKYGELLLAGVKIHEYRPTMFHNKTLVVDGVFSTIGSINFDARSMSKNAENSLAFYDRAFAAEMETMFAEDRAKCHEVTHHDWKRRGLWQKLTEILWWLWEPLY